MCEGPLLQAHDAEGKKLLKRTSAEEIRREMARASSTASCCPGTALDETQLAAEFAVSRTPVREALRLLGGQRAGRPAAACARRWWPSPSEEMLRGMFEVMGDLEALCAGAGRHVRWTRAEREALDSAAHARWRRSCAPATRRATPRPTTPSTARSMTARTTTIWPRSPARRGTRLQPFRRAQFGALGRLGKSHHEHGLIVEAILRGDGAAAADAMRSPHLDRRARLPALYAALDSFR